MRWRGKDRRPQKLGLSISISDRVRAQKVSEFTPTQKGAMPAAGNGSFSEKHTIITSTTSLDITVKIISNVWASHSARARKLCNARNTVIGDSKFHHVCFSIHRASLTGPRHGDPTSTAQYRSLDRRSPFLTSAIISSLLSSLHPSFLPFSISPPPSLTHTGRTPNADCGGHLGLTDDGQRARDTNQGASVNLVEFALCFICKHTHKRKFTREYTHYGL